MMPPQRLALIAASTSSILFVQLFPFAPSGDNGARSPLAHLTPAALANASTAAKSLFALPVSSKPGRSQGSGSRGCEFGEIPEITLLIPSQEFVGQTVSGHPTFFWKVSQPIAMPVKFTLMRPGDIEPIYEKQFETSPGEMVAVELPADRPELKPGELYSWTVSVVCNEKRPSANPFYVSWIERVPTSAELEQALSSAQTERDRALAYARSGAWYDALAAFEQAKAANPADPQLEDDFNALLATVGLQKTATAFR